MRGDVSRFKHSGTGRPQRVTKKSPALLVMLGEITPAAIPLKGPRPAATRTMTPIGTAASMTVPSEKEGKC